MCNFNLNCLRLAQTVQISEKDGPQKKQWSLNEVVTVSHRQPTTGSISATWCAARRLNTPCPCVSRHRSYSSPPNNGCFENAMILASCRQNVTPTACAGDTPSAMSHGSRNTQTKAKTTQRGDGCACHGRHVGASPSLASAYRAPRPYCWACFTKGTRQ